MRLLGFVLTSFLVFLLCTSFSPPVRQAEKQAYEMASLAVPEASAECVSPQAVKPVNVRAKEEATILFSHNKSLPEGKQLKHPHLVAGTLPEVREMKKCTPKYLIPYGKRA